ncbi:LuxR C-terminal-related transcriptional regulator [Lichenihabitans sp. Uapishka_5]|uniref:LuxR C-terminal-related transcriptional regulator n=1 Tax=Lichenihabitans sp. Uapishka_5 TaxID=3037302 RepID=UPI0029E7CD46|nr:LuxR C-terminal-related transcriptional regulator [Lichenihabitans sp. Uapishka_5]MDX7951252.1 LuxR C-terminal-related transcriptional regulator [Lichenihabitans sp. Uapishka_5]
MNPAALHQAATTLLIDVVAEGRWFPALEALMAEMNVLGGGLARTTPPNMFALPSGGVRQPFADFQAGKAPPLSRLSPLTPTPADGFLADYMAQEHAHRSRDPFYQEFLRSRHCVHQVSAFLDHTDAGAVTAMIYRTEAQGRFEAADLQALQVVLPYMRAATMAARCGLQGEAKRQAGPFEQRGEPVVSLDIGGRIMAINTAAESARGDLFDIVGHRLTSVSPGDQPRLDRGLRQACEAGRPALVTLTRFSGDGRVMALMVPIQGHARDVFRAVSVLVAFIAVDRPAMPDTQALDLLREAAHLTGRESDVVRLIGQGQRPREIAKALGMSEATARVHLRSATGKLGVHSQAELAALLRRLS